MVEVERVSDASRVTTIAYAFREEFSLPMLHPVKWSYDLHFASNPLVVRRAVEFAVEIRTEQTYRREPSSSIFVSLSYCVAFEAPAP